MNSQPGTSTGGIGPPATVQEFSIRVPKSMKKKHHVMRFNATLNVDFAQWKVVKLERENNMKEFKGMDEDTPRFGAGSEYNRDLREEVRRKKFGIISKRYRPEAQPWILKVGGKSGKKFRGIREGGVGENAAFYVFTHAPDGAIEAYPLNEWYNFQPIQRYKSLSAEEAEQEFGRRKKVLNFFSLMLRKRLRGDDDEPEEPEEGKSKKGGGKSKDLKISEMDEWIESDEESDEDSDAEKKEEDDSDKEKEKKKKSREDEKNKKKKKKDVDEEAIEESDDGDEEGRELDYISDSSDSDSEEEQNGKAMKSVAEEDALRKLLTSDEDSDEEPKKSGDESDKEENEEKTKKEKEKEAKEAKDNKEKNKKKKTKAKKGKEDNKKDTSSDFSSDSSDSEAETKPKKKKSENTNSRSASPNIAAAESSKRKYASMPSDLGNSDNSNSPVATPAKKMKTETPSLPATFAGVVNVNSKDDYGITEEAVRRYLMRKPMTTTELLTKFKNKKTGVSSEKLVETMTQILKKINPVKQRIQGKMYLSIKPNK